MRRFVNHFGSGRDDGDRTRKTYQEIGREQGYIQILTETQMGLSDYFIVVIQMLVYLTPSSVFWIGEVSPLLD